MGRFCRSVAPLGFFVVLSICALAFSSRAAAAPARTNTSSQCLTGYWRMNGDGTDLVSGNTLVPEANVTFTVGHLNGAATIDGSQVGGLSAPALHGYDLLPTGFTVETWMRTASLPGTNPRVVCAESSGVSQAQIWQIYVCKANCTPGRITFSVLRYGVETALSSTRSVDNGDWHHVAVTYDGSHLRLYVDGAPDGSVQAPGLQVLVGGGTLHVARQQNTADQFDGQIDELRIWNVARPADSIAADRERELSLPPVCPPETPGPCTATDSDPEGIRFSWSDVSDELGYHVYRDGDLLRTVAADTTSIWDVPEIGTHRYCVSAFDGNGDSGECCDYGTRWYVSSSCAVPDTGGLVAHWKLDGNGNDEVSGNTLVSNCPECVSYTSGVSGLAARFDASRPMGMTAPALGAYGLSSSGFTVDLWARTTVDVGWDHDLVAAWTDTAYWGVALRNVPDRCLWSYGSGSCGSFSSDPFGFTLSQWHHVALRYDGSDVIEYLDGVQVYSANEPGLCAYVAGGTIRLLSGDCPSCTGYVDFDEVRVWRRALSPVEIMAAAGHANPLPSAPASCTASNGETCQPVQISWSDVSDETGYRVYRDGLLIATLPADQTSTTDTPSPGLHVYSVKAFNSYGMSPQTCAFGFMPWPVPARPTLAPATADMDSVRLVWSDVAHEIGYRVIRNGGLLGTLPADDTIFVDHAPIEGMADYCVEAFDICGTSEQHCVTVTHPCWPATAGWVRDVGGPLSDVHGAIVQARDGGFASLSSAEGDFRLSKLDSLGHLLWSRTYGTGRTETAYALAPTWDGGFIMVGASYQPAPTYWDLYVVKTDSLGVAAWSRVHGGSSTERGWAVQQTDTGFVVIGSKGSRIWVVGIEAADGDTAWTRLVLPDFTALSSMDACRTLDGGWALTANSATEPDLVKTDSDWNQLWAVPVSVYGSIRPLADGSFLLTGKEVPDSWYLEKADSLGVTSWDPGLGTVHEAVPAAGGGFLVAGEGCCTPDGNTAAVFARTDSLGNVIWTRTENDSGQSAAYSVTATRDGGYAFAGERRSPAGAYYGHFERGGCSVSSLAGVDEPIVLPTRIALGAPAPNPTRGAVVFRVSLPRAMDVRVNVFDVAGRLVQEVVRQNMTAGVHLLRWDPGAERKSSASGIYFLRLDAGGVHESRTIVRVK